MPPPPRTPRSPSSSKDSSRITPGAPSFGPVVGLPEVRLTSDADADAGSGRIRLTASVLESLGATVGDHLRVDVKRIQGGTGDWEASFLCTAAPWPCQVGESDESDAPAPLLDPTVQRDFARTRPEDHEAVLRGPLAARAQAIKGRIPLAASVVVSSPPELVRSGAVASALLNAALQPLCTYHLGRGAKARVVQEDPPCAKGGLFRIGPSTAITAQEPGGAPPAPPPPPAPRVRMASLDAAPAAARQPPALPATPPPAATSPREGPGAVPARPDAATRVGGMGPALAALRELVGWPLRYNREAEALGVKWPRGLLLHGPPGCGKTLLVQTVAEECGARVHSAGAASVFGAFAGESEKNLRGVFEAAEADAAAGTPTVVFLDEIDALCPARSGQKQHEARVGRETQS
mmetsp:Transcript_48868/g.156524  ORF Transcript_48868/g.156524 Transcript_48868/m.156524 type:complete len:406 (-) Transcript_48868:133-1350(-)